MVASALQSGIAERRAVFEAFARRLPAGRACGVVAGSDRIIDAIERFRFDDETVDYLIGAGVVSDARHDRMAALVPLQRRCDRLPRR